MIKVSSLHIHPIKSCASVSVEELRLDQRGPVGDRRCMVVDGNGRFITQREEPRLALVRAVRSGDHLSLSAPGMPECVALLGGARAGSGTRIAVEIFRYRGEALVVDRDVDAWFSAFLGRPARLVECGPDMIRPANRDWAAYDAEVAFSDGYPILLISEASLEALNERLDGRDPLPMSRFRPNIVVRGCAPFEEDDWRTLVICGVTIDVVKPCDRCAVTTIDPETAERGSEPLATLAKFRRSAAGVLFGQNCTARGPGSIEVGEKVEVVEAGGLGRTPDGWRVQPRG